MIIDMPGNYSMMQVLTTVGIISDC